MPYRHSGQGREVDRDHAAYPLVRRRANEYLKAFDFKQVLEVHRLIQGNGYAWINRDGAGRPLELIPLMPERTYPVRWGGQLMYASEVYTDAGQLELRKFPAEDIFHLKGLGYDGLQGYSVIAKARESLGLGMAAEKYGAIYFRNGSRPNIALEIPPGMPEQAQKNLRESWERAHSGLDQSHRVALLRMGVKLQQYSINARDSQLLETRAFQRVDVANWFGLPPHKLGDSSRTAYNSLEQENQAYLDDCLDPRLVSWEEECWDKLLSEREKARESHYFQFSRRELLRANLAARGAYYVQALTNGWMSRDEVRGEEGMNPIEGGAGARYFVPLNFTTVGGAEPDEDSTLAAQGSREGQQLIAVPDVRQSSAWSCGAAATAAVCQYFGVGPPTEAEAIVALGTTAAAGTRPQEIARVLLEAGLKVTAAADLTLDDLHAFWKQGWPVLCCLQSPTVPPSSHWTTVVGLGLDMVFLRDPLQADPMAVAAERFLELWHDQDADGNEYSHFGIAAGLELPHPEEEKPAAPAPGAAGGQSPGSILGPPAQQMPGAVSPQAASGAPAPAALPSHQDEPGRRLPPPEGRYADDQPRAPEGKFGSGAGAGVGPRVADPGSAAACIITDGLAPDDGAPEPSPATRAVLEDALGRMARRLTGDARRAARQPRTFLAWLDTFFTAHRLFVAQALTPAVGLLPEGSGWTALRAADLLLAEVRGRLLDASGRATAAQLSAVVEAAVDAPALAAALAERLLWHAEDTADPFEPRYSPDQPRGPDGKFGSGASGQARELIAGIQSGKIHPDQAHELTQHLSKMTVKELTELKKEHGVKASGGTKAALAQKLSDRIGEKLANKPKAVEAPIPKPAPVKTEEKPPEPKPSVSAPAPIDRSAPMAERLKAYTEGDRKVAELQKLGTHMEELKQKADAAKQASDTFWKQHAASKSAPLPGKTMSETMGHHMSETLSARMEYEAAAKDVRTRALSALGAKNPIALEPTYKESGIHLSPETIFTFPQKATPEMKNASTEAYHFVGGMTERDQNKDIASPKIISDPGTLRASYDGMFGRIHAYPDDQEVSTFVHELGHHLEDTLPGVKAALIEFRQHRVGSEKPVSLRAQFGSEFDRGETGVKDGFDKVFGPGPEAYYAGKPYYGILGKLGGVRSTEILSMGLEAFHKDPTGFARKDPEYCKMVLGILDGSLRK